MQYDVSDGVLNWVRNLDSYQELYNIGLHTAIGMTPYECFVGSKPNREDNSTQADVVVGLNARFIVLPHRDNISWAHMLMSEMRGDLYISTSTPQHRKEGMVWRGAT